MQTYRIETTITQDGTLLIKKLPFQAGDKVQVIVRSQEREEKSGERYPLHGKPIRYADPFGSVAQNDWTVLQ